MQRRIVCLMGPTASGKTALAIELVKHYPFEVVSVDSALVYKGLDVGSAKPTADELALAPHRLISFLDPSESYSAARFRTDAIAAINDIWQRGKIPLFVGGTMLYFRTLILGMSDLPEADSNIRAEIDALAAEKGWSHVHDCLSLVDPISASRLKPSDAQRVQRALEVYRISGKPISDYQNQQEDHKSHAPKYASDIGLEPIQLGIMPDDRAVLHQRIEARFHDMLRQGFLDEVKALHARGDLDSSLPAVRAVGYRQAWSYLNKEIDYDEMVYRGIVATRQLAKRQMTWLRNWYGVEMFLTDSSNTHVISRSNEPVPTFRVISEYLSQQLQF